MSYYHCHIILAEQKRDKEFILNDLTKEHLLETILYPYVANEQFMFDGYIINPKQVKRLKVTETENSVTYYVQRHNESMKRAGIADFGTNRRELPINQGKDVTLELVKIAKEKTEIKPDISSKTVTEINEVDDRKVFVVHGHDMATLHELCRLLKDEFDLEPVVLSEQPSVGLDTIISKFERLASNCFCAIILLTPDDKVEKSDLNRARQNVIFELGYFLGMLRSADRRKIIILKKGDVEIPSDINGVLYCQFQDSVTEVFYQLKKQFEIWK
jgi:predicted nucleotide-binding protein